MIRRRRPDGSAKTGLDSICSQGSSAASGPSPHPPLNPYARFPRIRLTDDPLDTVTLPSDSRRYRPGPSPGAASSPAATASGVGSGARRACAPTACPQRTCCHPIDHAERHICSSEAVSWRIRAQVADDRYRSTAGSALSLASAAAASAGTETARTVTASASQGQSGGVCIGRHPNASAVWYTGACSGHDEPELRSRPGRESSRSGGAERTPGRASRQGRR